MSMAVEALKFILSVFVVLYIPVFSKVLDHLPMECVVEHKLWVAYVPLKYKVVVKNIYEGRLNLPSLYVDCLVLLKLLDQLGVYHFGVVGQLWVGVHFVG